MSEHEFKIRFLDHVAIRVADIQRSADWYEDVLGMKRYSFKEWGEFPIFMLNGKTGIALFPANLKDNPVDPLSRNVMIDHFAFNVSNQDFRKAQNHLDLKGIDFQFQDHHYFHSIYFRDPDGHKVELTTIVVDEDKFY